MSEVLSCGGRQRSPHESRILAAAHGDGRQAAVAMAGMRGVSRRAAVDTVLSPDIGRQLLQRGLLDEIDLHIAPVLLGQGIRLYEHLGGSPIYLHRVGTDDPTAEMSVRYRPATK